MPHSASTDALEQAENEILQTFGDRVSFLGAGKSVLQYGRRTLALSSTRYTIMDAPDSVVNENLIQTNSINRISSTEGLDDQEVVIEGFTLQGDNQDKVFVSQTATLNGQNKVNLSTGLARVTRVYNNDSSDIAGNVYVYEDGTISLGVPQTDNDIHIELRGQGGQVAAKAATAVAQDEYLIILSSYFAIDRSESSGNADWRIEVAERDKVFLPVVEGTVRSAGDARDFIQYDAPIIVPKNGEVRMTGVASALGTNVFGWFSGFLASVIT